MKILITGANSYIGTSVENYFLSFCAQTQNPASLSPAHLSANCKAVAQSPVSFCPSSCAESQEPVSLGCNDSRIASRNDFCNVSRNELRNVSCACQWSTGKIAKAISTLQYGFVFVQ